MTQSAANDNLLFAWEPPRRRQFVILGFLAASAVGHALCFYLFQIVYPPTVALLPPPARVNLISGGSEEGRTLLRWIGAEDPALASTTQRPPEAKAFALPQVNYVPSYVTLQPAMKELPAFQPDLRSLSSQPPAPVPNTRVPVQSPALVISTAIIFSKELAVLGAVKKPLMKLIASTREPPQSAKFRIGVTDRGVVRYCFLESSSGDSALDEQGRHYLTLCRFVGSQSADPGAQNHLNWAVASIEWGNDLTVPPLMPSGNVLP